jgi:hypothetical protein
MSIKPIRPEEVPGKQPYIPDWMIEGFNELICKHYKDGKATFHDNTIHRCLERYDLATEDDSISTDEYIQSLGSQGINEIPDLYRKAGWEVVIEVKPIWTTPIRFWTFTKPT